MARVRSDTTSAPPTRSRGRATDRFGSPEGASRRTGFHVEVAGPGAARRAIEARRGDPLHCTSCAGVGSACSMRLARRHCGDLPVTRPAPNYAPRRQRTRSTCDAARSTCDTASLSLLAADEREFMGAYANGPFADTFGWIYFDLRGRSRGVLTVIEVRWRRRCCSSSGTEGAADQRSDRSSLWRTR